MWQWKKYKKCCLVKDRKNKKEHSSKGDLMGDKNSKGKIRDNPSAKKMEQSLDGMKQFKKFTDAGLLDGLIPFGLDKEGVLDALQNGLSLEEEFELITNMPDRFNKHFLKLGWIAHETMSFEEMQKAVQLADEGKFDEAELGLIKYYSNNLEFNIKMVQCIEEFKPRNELLQLAYEDFLAGRYHACIPVIFIIIDGVVADTKEIEGNKGFFAENENLYAWDSIAAHKSGLLELSKLLYKSRGTTNSDELEIPYRNGILHGRDLGYANKQVATKTWATLFALRDGIVAIKQKGKEPKEEPKKNLLENLMENQKRMKLLDDWKPRKLKSNEDIPEFGKPSDYEDGSPERALVEFFEYWQNGNFGKIAQMLDKFTLEEFTLKHLAGKLRRDVFNQKKLESYRILVVNDEMPLGYPEITTELTIKNKDDVIKKEVTFTLTYENEEGESEIWTMRNGRWRFVGCFNEIKENYKRLFSDIINLISKGN